MRNLRTLEQEGMVSSRSDYQEIINAIAKVYTCRYNIALSGGLFPLSMYLGYFLHKKKCEYKASTVHVSYSDMQTCIIGRNLWKQQCKRCGQYRLVKYY